MALYSNTNGALNTASGAYALYANTSGYDNTANGARTLYSNISGCFNTANGYFSLLSNLNGNANTANGYRALGSNTNGNDNTADGAFALENNTSGSFNIALGYNAGSSLTTGSNNIAIGNPGTSSDDATIRIGTQGTQTNTFIAGIYGATVSGAALYVNSSGQLGTLTSSARYKTDIQTMGQASDALLALRPVTFRYKPEIDAQGLPRFGLVAEEVEKVNPELVIHDPDGKPYTVRYEAVNALLLNEFLKEHRKVEDLESRLHRLEQLLSAKNGGGK
jgi:hypothetical protein